MIQRAVTSFHPHWALFCIWPVAHICVLPAFPSFTTPSPKGRSSSRHWIQAPLFWFSSHPLQLPLLWSTLSLPPACPFTPVTDLCFRFFPHTTQTCQFLKHTMSPVKRITIFFQPSPLPSFPGRPAALGTLFANSSLPAFSCHPSPTSSKPTLRTPRTWALCLPL